MTLAAAIDPAQALAFPLDPTVYAGLVGIYLGWAALARGREVPRHKGLFLGLGLFCLWLALETPIDTVSDRYLDSVHMVQHVLLFAFAPPLLLLSLTEDMAGTLARVGILRALGEPVPAQVVAAAVMLGWHLPPLYEATLHSEPLHVLEHLMFIGSGLLFWWPVIAATSAHASWRLSSAGKMIYLFVGTLPMDLVGLAFQFSRVPFYDFYVRAPRLVTDLDPAGDQSVAGGILQAVGKVPSVVAGVVLLFRWLAEEDPAEEAGTEAVHPG